MLERLEREQQQLFDERDRGIPTSSHIPPSGHQGESGTIPSSSTHSLQFPSSSLHTATFTTSTPHSSSTHSNTNYATQASSSYGTQTKPVSGSSYGTLTKPASGSSYGTQTKAVSGSSYSTSTQSNTNYGTQTSSSYGTQTKPTSGSSYGILAKSVSGSSYGTETAGATSGSRSKSTGSVPHAKSPSQSYGTQTRSVAVTASHTPSRGSSVAGSPRGVATIGLVTRTANGYIGRGGSPGASAATKSKVDLSSLYDECKESLPARAWGVIVHPPEMRTCTRF